MTRRTRVRDPLGSVLAAIRALLAAIRHVRTGGATTRRRARAQAAAPPAKCPTCRQAVPHSPRWEDHLDTCDPRRPR